MSLRSILTSSGVIILRMLQGCQMAPGPGYRCVSLLQESEDCSHQLPVYARDELPFCFYLERYHGSHCPRIAAANEQ